MSQSSSLIIDGKPSGLLQPVGSGSSVPYLHVPRQHCLMVLEKKRGNKLLCWVCVLAQSAPIVISWGPSTMQTSRFVQEWQEMSYLLLKSFFFFCNVWIDPSFCGRIVIRKVFIKRSLLSF